MTNHDFLCSNELDTELIIGLVCSVGTETGLVIELLRERLGRAGYRVELVKVSSDVIPQLVEIEDPGADPFKRYSDLMTAGNDCRELEPCDDSILAHGIAACISVLRRKLYWPERNPTSGCLEDDPNVYADDEARTDERRVRFEPFVGVGPRRFFELFSMNLGSSYKLDRKISDTGAKREWHIEKAQLRLQLRPTSYLRLETIACQAFGEKINPNPTNENPNDQNRNSGTGKDR